MLNIHTDIPGRITLGPSRFQERLGLFLALGGLLSVSFLCIMLFDSHPSAANKADRANLITAAIYVAYYGTTFGICGALMVFMQRKFILLMAEQKLIYKDGPLKTRVFDFNQIQKIECVKPEIVQANGNEMLVVVEFNGGERLLVTRGNSIKASALQRELKRVIFPAPAPSPGLDQGIP